MSKHQSADEVVVDHSHDRVFYLTFSAVLGVLVLITVIISGIANTIDPEEPTDPLRLAQIEERIAPVGAVYTDAAAIPKPAAAAEAKPRSPAEVVSGVCAGCHIAGVLGATKLDDAAGWQARLDAAGGLDGLVSAAIAGKGAMPPRGGDASLSDADIRAAVEAILAGAGL
ncbi:MAG: c-type cytochrome [Oceanococcaceae bacterium]